MADVSHELGSLRHIVDSPLSSKVAMFDNAANRHKEQQLLNPFSQVDGRRSPKPTFSKEEYGKPLAGSLTEQRGQKASIHVLKEMLELCQIINSEGYPVQDEPEMRVIPFGELFNIYNYISDKCVGICLRARKHKLIDFEGECLFQRRDDHVPVFLLKPIKEIKKILEDKQEEIRRSVSPAPQATSVLLDKQKQSRRSVSPMPDPKPKAATPEPSPKTEPVPAPQTEQASAVATSENSSSSEAKTDIKQSETEVKAVDVSAPAQANPLEASSNPTILVQDENNAEVKPASEVNSQQSSQTDAASEPSKEEASKIEQPATKSEETSPATKQDENNNVDSEQENAAAAAPS